MSLDKRTHEIFEIAIVGAGPGGLSAAGHCANKGIDHILLESSGGIAQTIESYQQGKYVMAEPQILPLRSPVSFEAGLREEILENWKKDVDQLGINCRYNAEVSSIKRISTTDDIDSHLLIETTNGDALCARNVILAIGLQGNPRLLGITGDDAEWVQYQLKDPKYFKDQTIAVVGAGDAAIENAIALSKTNHVSIVNRKTEFTRAKEGNLKLVLGAIETGELECWYSSVPQTIVKTDNGKHKGQLILETETGQSTLDVDLVLARLGAIAPRKLLESFGITFPSNDPESVPELTNQYESNVKGIYIIGALAGYPLIKQAMNQGYEVVEYILGNEVDPADHFLLAEKFKVLKREADVNNVLAEMQRRIPLFSDVNALMFREFILDSQVLTPELGSVIFEKNDYTNSFYTVFEGEVKIEVAPELAVTVSEGSFFGEMSLISGRRRSATIRAGENCILIETPRRRMNSLVSSVNAVKRTLDETFILRTIQQKFAPNMPFSQLYPLAKQVTINKYNAGDVIFKEGDTADSLHFIRLGSVTVSNVIDGKEIIISYVPANSTIGEMGLLGDSVRSATVKAATKTETLSISKKAFNLLLEESDGLQHQMRELMESRHQQNLRTQQSTSDTSIMSFLMGQGLGEATDVLLIDEEICVGCDYCEKACASTHDGNSRLDRRAGTVFEHLNIPTSCRHCEDPACMKDCPPDAIHRNGVGGEVVIDDTCIGCGNCEKNCPYGVIQMAYPATTKFGFWSWLLFGSNSGTGQVKPAGNIEEAFKKATKCDMCSGIKGGPACVRACPTGAAMRLKPENFHELFIPK